MSKDTDWQYAFSDLEKGYADINLDNHFHEYQFEVKETVVEYYESSSTELSFDGDNGTCDFRNKYTPEMPTVESTKTWDDYSNVMGYRPKEIKVLLYRDGVLFDECLTSQRENWSYSFNDFYQCHDQDVAYTYTVSEEPIPGYALKVDGYNMKNTLATGLGYAS